jgi:hypothetical protein
MRGCSCSRKDSVAVAFDPSRRQVIRTPRGLTSINRPKIFDSRKDAKHEAKPAGSERLAAGSNLDYKQTVGRWQWALGSKKANTREQSAKIRHQQAEVSKALSAERLISAE